MATTIKNIIFDLGGVILNIDYQLSIQAFRELGAEQFDQIFSQLKQDNLFDDYETGRISTATFRQRLREKIDGYLTDAQIDAAWNQMLLDLPGQRLALLEKLASRYRLFLLSNTNDLHLAGFHKIIREQHGLKSIDGYFEKTYYSNQIGLRKPDPAIFRYILKENQLQPAETLFIDDSPQHIEGARQGGIQGKHLTKDETLEEWLTTTDRIQWPDNVPEQ